MKRLLVCLLGLAFVLPAAAVAQRDDKDEEKDDKEKFEKLVEDATLREGFFDTYEKDGHLYLAAPRERLGEDFLLSFEIAQGIGGRRLFGGSMLSAFEPKIVALEKHHNKIYLLQRPHRYVAPEGSAEANAVELTFGSSVLASAKIEATREDSADVIDIYSWLVSDLSGISRRVRFAVSDTPGKPGSASFDKGRSYLRSVKAFPINLSIIAKLTFKPSKPVFLRTVPDSRYLPVSIHYTIAALPEEPMTPRMADDRVGFFMTVHKDFSRDEGKDFFVRYVNHWRLECAGAPDAYGLCEPKKPIVYHVDRTVPEQYRPAIMAAVEEFNEAFKEAGFRNAIRAELLPEDADAEDIRYATIRWNTSDERGYGAIGPSIVDPRTGETLDADILMEAGMVMGFRNAWRTLIDPTAAIEEMFNASPEELEDLAQGAEMANLGAEIAAQGTLIRALLAAKGEIDPNEPVPMAYVNEVLKWVTMHEVGHTLGMRHNFRSSYDTPNDKLHDPAWTAENGVFSSVMEYPTPNISPRGQPDGHYYNHGMGSYDKWAIAFAYTPDPERAKELARQAALPGHAYGTDQDARGSGALDPTVNVYDLGRDPMAWGKERADLIRGLWMKLPTSVLADNSPYHDVTDAFQSLLSQYGRAVATGIKYIGGQYQYRDHVGDPEARGPFVMVPKARQKEALDFVVEYAFTETAFEIPQGVLQQFGADRWSHWGNTNTFNGRIDYPLHEMVLGMQRALLNRITHPMVLARMRDAEMKYGPENVLGIPELMENLTQAIWSEVWTRPGRNVPAMRRDLQRAYLDRLTRIVTNAPSRMPADARSVARLRLQELQTRISRRLSPPYSFDDYTLAHLQEAQARVERALEAGLELEN